MKSLIYSSIKDSIETKTRLLEDASLLETLDAVCNAAIELYQRPGNKVILAGNGGSAADAQHIAAELVGRYGFDRPSIAALALTTDTSNLTAIGNDYGYDQIFSRQLEGMGVEGDLFIGISTSGHSKNLIEAITVAKGKGITSVALVGKDGGEMAAMSDYAIIVPSNETPRIQESHILLGHIFCDIIEQSLFSKA